LAYSILQYLEIVENIRKILLYFKTRTHSMHGSFVVISVLISLVTVFIQNAMSADRNATFFLFLNNRILCILLLLSLYALGSEGDVWSPSFKLFYDTTVFSIFEVFYFFSLLKERLICIHLIQGNSARGPVTT